MLCCNELCDAVTGRVYVCGLTMNIEQVMDVGMCAARRASECVRVYVCICACACVCAWFVAYVLNLSGMKSFSPTVRRKTPNRDFSESGVLLLDDIQTFVVTLQMSFRPLNIELREYCGAVVESIGVLPFKVAPCNPFQPIRKMARWRRPPECV